MKKADEATPNERLSKERIQHSWSQQEVADQVGTTPVNVSRWERGHTSPSAYFRSRLSVLFGKSEQELGFLQGVVDDEPGEESAAEESSSSSVLEAFPSCWNVPYRRNPFFTGRQAVLEHLHDTLTSGKTAVLTQAQAISGLGGVGKTQTAVEYAYRYHEDYPTVLWARADSREMLVSDFVSIAGLLNLPEQKESDQSRVVIICQRWLQESTDWLLILDNVEDLALAREFLPTGGKGHILLTTRAQATGGIAQRVELEKMELEEGAFFLLRRAKLIAAHAALDDVSPADRAEAEAIVEVIDGLPLALDQAGAYIEETDCGLAGYLRRYYARRTDLLKRRGGLAFDHPEPVTTTWSLSFEKLEQANPAAADLLRLCAFLHPDAIPEEIITEGAPELGSVLQSVAADPLELDTAIQELRKYSLVKRDAKAKLLNIHRLVQAVLKDAMSEDRQRQWAERVVHAVNRVFPDGEFETWQTCEQYLPHAQVCATLIGQWGMAFPEAARLLDRAGFYLQQRAQYAQAEPLLSQALAIREQPPGREDPDVATTLHNLALVYHDRGKFAQAEQFYQRAVTVREQALGPEHPDVAKSLNKLALLYYDQDRYIQAEPLYLRALTIREKKCGPNHLDVAQTLNDLGLLYYAQHKYAEAELLYLRALAIYEQSSGPELPEMAENLNNLAALYHKQGKYTDAEPLYLRALAIHERTLGPTHPYVAINLNNLAQLYRLQGQYIQAEPLQERALEISEQSLGLEHPDVGLILNNLAEVYRALGKYAEAQPLYLQALAIREQKPNHPDLAQTLNNLALLYKAQGRYAEAEPLFQRALAIYEQTLGAEEPEVVAVRENYADLHTMG